MRMGYISVNCLPSHSTQSYPKRPTPKFGSYFWGGPKADIPGLSIQALPGISSDFVQSIQNAVKTFPPSFLKSIQQEGYKIILAHSLAQGLRSENVHLSPKEHASIKDKLALAYDTSAEDEASGKPRKRLIVLEPNVSTLLFTQAILNHELCHAFVVANPSLLSCQSLQQAYKDDKKTFVNAQAQRLFPIEQHRQLNQVFFANEKEGFDEALVEVLAASCTGGNAYGQVFGIPDRRLIQKCFPELQKAILNKKLLN